MYKQGISGRKRYVLLLFTFSYQGDTLIANKSHAILQIKIRGKYKKDG